MLQVYITQIQLYLILTKVAGEPTGLFANISNSNSTHVNITVYWKSPNGNVTGYVIYYQSKGGLVISDTVNGSEIETNSLDGLQRGVTYYISIVALSEFLPSPLVGPHIISSKSLLYFTRHHYLLSLAVVAEPTNLTVSMSEYSRTHVNVTVSWEPADDTFTTGYIIHYDSNNMEKQVDISENYTRFHTLNGFERGAPYSISLEALSENLNSTVGPYRFFGK